ncbi:hypothetical protein K2X85_00845 [bacterium]|nr:hypothetical protein [bacterium]
MSLNLDKPQSSMPSEASLPSRLPIMISLCRPLYELAWWVVSIVWTIAVMRRPGAREELAERAGYLPSRPIEASGSLWIHAVSVGEYLSALPIIDQVKRRDPKIWVLVTISNPQAHAMATKGEPAADVIAWMPWDSHRSIIRAFDRVNPDSVGIIECEIWPNFILEAKKRSCRLIMMNARIYEKDFAGYHLARFLFKPILNGVDEIYAQSALDRERFLSLGVSPGRVWVEGNSKYDRLPSAPPERTLPMWVKNSSGGLVVLASTHPGEEGQILAMMHSLQKEIPSLRMIIAPRDPSRGELIKGMVKEKGMSAFCKTEIGQIDESSADVMVLDTLGELPALLAAADVVFMGGSLVPMGGHNPIEPAVWGKPIFMGPSFFNFRDVVSNMRKSGGIEIVASAAELMEKIRRLLLDPEAGRLQGVQAADFIARQRGASIRYAQRLLDMKRVREAA